MTIWSSIQQNLLHGKLSSKVKFHLFQCCHYFLPQVTAASMHFKLKWIQFLCDTPMQHCNFCAGGWNAATQCNCGVLWTDPYEKRIVLHFTCSNSGNSLLLFFEGMSFHHWCPQFCLRSLTFSTGSMHFLSDSLLRTFD